MTKRFDYLAYVGITSGIAYTLAGLSGVSKDTDLPSTLAVSWVVASSLAYLTGSLQDACDFIRTRNRHKSIDNKVSSH